MAPYKIPIRQLALEYQFSLAYKLYSIVEHIHYDENDDPIFVEVHGYPIFNDQGEVIQMIEYSLNITDRKLAEQELKKARVNGDFAADIAKLAYWEQDFDKQTFTVTDNFYKIMNISFGDNKWRQ